MRTDSIKDKYYMEPTIYKPSIYKGAGIYKAVAEGGIYKGRGVYKDGADKLKVWELDIPNLVLSNHTDEYGLNYTFAGSISKTDNDTKLMGVNYFDMWIYPVFNLGDVKQIEMRASVFEIGRAVYFGAVGVFFILASTVTNGAVVLGTLDGHENWTLFEGVYNSVDVHSGWRLMCYDHIDYTKPITYKIILDDIVTLYVNDVKIAEKINDYSFAIDNIFKLLNFSSGGTTNAGNKVVIDYMKVWYK